eukprot:10936368-Ditylum_brightwellii.AAC.1
MMSKEKKEKVKEKDIETISKSVIIVAAGAITKLTTSKSYTSKVIASADPIKDLNKIHKEEIKTAKSRTLV